jgi:hypothetical protein
MDRNLLCLSVGLATAAFSLTAIITHHAGGFAAPGQYGWVYNYQTLIGVAGAVAAALFTVGMMHREQRQQHEHFSRQMDVLTRADRLLVSRETARIIPTLRKSLVEIRQDATCAKIPYQGASSFAKRLKTVFTDLLKNVDENAFSALMPLLDDHFTEIRGRIQSEGHNVLERIRTTFAGRNPDVDRETVMMSNASLDRFPEIESDLGDLIEYLQNLRCAYGLPRLGLRYDESSAMSREFL